MDKTLRNTIIAGILLIGIPFTYYFLIAPFKNNYDFNKCLKDSEEYFNQKQSEINSHLESLNKEKEIIDKEVNEKVSNRKIGENIDKLVEPRKKINGKIKLIESDLEKLIIEKEEKDKICYKKFK